MSMPGTLGEVHSAKEQDGEHVCRICRCEGTEDDKLFHPCKCRGSIKYIHQGCLDSWLSFSNKKICDICSEPFAFDFKFQENTPAVVPLKVFTNDIFHSILSLLYSGSVIALSIISVVLIPIAFSLSLLGYNWLLGCEIPQNESMMETLRFGNFTGTSLPLLNSIKNDDLLSLYTTTFLGWMYLIMIALFCIVMLSARSWVTSDDGFNKIANRKIGAEFLNDNFQRIIRDLQGNINHHNNEPNGAGMANLEAERERALQNFVELIARRENQEIDSDNEGDDDGEGEILQDHDDNAIDHVAVPPLLNEDELAADIDPQDVQRILQIGGVLPQERMERVARALREARDLREGEAREAERIARLGVQFPEQIAAEELEAAEEAEAAENDDGNAAVNFMFVPGPGIVLQTMVIVCALAFAIGILYFVPCEIGLITINSLYGLRRSIPIFRLLVSYIPLTIPEIPYEMTQLHLVQEYVTSIPILKSFITRVLLPYQEMLSRATNWSPEMTFLDMGHLFLLGYITVGFLITFIMSHLERACSPENPLRGVYRDIYIGLLQVVLSVKVISIFFIELIVFPIFCGFQLHFVAIPVFIEDKSKFFASENWWFTLMGTMINEWTIGTLFMYFFASYVAMVRKSILRKGVLFFIRSPDDPNVRLVHDALIKPFGLQLSRILLSGVVYTLYIILEFCLVTWGVRLFSPVEVLPIKTNPVLLICYIAAMYLARNYLFVTFPRTFSSYWEKSFVDSCSYLRLSSFIVGTEKIHERGHVVQRNFFKNYLPLFFTDLPEPNYQEPVLDSEVSDFFKNNPDVQSVFVPDGDFIRAPDNDNVSRLFIKKLFVKVTHTDQLLETPREITKEEEEMINPFGDEEPVPITTYKVVYRPPHFIMRVFALLGCLWYRSFVLAIGFLVTSTLMGKLISYSSGSLFVAFGNVLASFDINWIKDLGLTMEGYSFTKLDIRDIFIGSVILNFMLDLYPPYGEVNGNAIKVFIDGVVSVISSPIWWYIVQYITRFVTDFFIFIPEVDPIPATRGEQISMEEIIRRSIRFMTSCMFVYRGWFMFVNLMNYNDNKRAALAHKNSSYLYRTMWEAFGGIIGFVIGYLFKLIPISTITSYTSNQTNEQVRRILLDMANSSNLSFNMMKATSAALHSVFYLVDVLAGVLSIFRSYNHKLKTKYYTKTKILINLEEEDAE